MGSSVLNYLKIFSKLLIVFGGVGSIAIAIGFTPRLGSVSIAVSIMGLQALTGGVILYGFKLEREGQLALKKLQYGGWLLVILLIIICQIWINVGNIKI